MGDYIQMWKDLNSNKSYLIKVNSKRNVRADGRENAKFIPTVSGHNNFKQRINIGKINPSNLPELPSYMSEKYDDSAYKGDSNKKPKIYSQRAMNATCSLNFKSLSPIKNKRGKLKSKFSISSYKEVISMCNFIQKRAKLNSTMLMNNSIRLSPEGLIERAPTVKEMYDNSHPSFNQYMDKDFMNKRNFEPFYNVNDVSQLYFVLFKEIYFHSHYEV